MSPLRNLLFNSTSQSYLISVKVLTKKRVDVDLYEKYLFLRHQQAL